MESRDWIEEIRADSAAMSAWEEEMKEERMESISPSYRLGRRVEVKSMEGAALTAPPFCRLWISVLGLSNRL